MKNPPNPFGLIAPGLDAACTELGGAPLTGARRRELPEEEYTPVDIYEIVRCAHEETEVIVSDEENDNRENFRIMAQSILIIFEKAEMHDLVIDMLMHKFNDKGYCKLSPELTLKKVEQEIRAFMKSPHMALPSNQIITTVRQVKSPKKRKFTKVLKFVFGSGENLQKLLAGKDGVSVAHIL